MDDPIFSDITSCDSPIVPGGVDLLSDSISSSLILPPK